jgi:hypothetical protein
LFLHTLIHNFLFVTKNGSGAHPAFYPMGTGGTFPGGKIWPERDVDHSPPFGAEVNNEQELYLLSSQTPPWRVAGQFHFTKMIKTFL